ncbi:hypothetical protein ABR738_00030 [Streptomyces sp. Edi4]|uniref:hypothetical protein n=1 Tax=Streptomyces sp. Edi4 TaxID=3162527 RepID=UPI0033068F5E
MNRNELLTKNRWKVRYSYTCICDPTCWYAKNGRHTGTTYLNNGEQEQGTEAVAESLARFHRHEGVEVETVWQESDEERDARLKAQRRDEADAARGIWWGMGGAN